MRTGKGALGTAIVGMTLATACGSTVSEEELISSNAGHAGPAGTGVSEEWEPDDGPLSTVLGARATASGATTNSPARAASAPRGSDVAADERRGGNDSTVDAPDEREEVVLGSFGTSTGPIGAQVAPIPVAVRAWMQDVNARGGLNGHPVRILIEDDGGKPERALAIARSMIEEKGVSFFFGNFGATTVQAVVPYLEEHRIPLVGGMSGNPIEDRSPMIFNAETGADAGTGRSHWVPITTLTDTADAVALLYCRESDVCTAGAARVREYAPVVGGHVVYEAQVSLAQPDFTAEVLAARNAGARAVIAVIDYASFKRIMTSARRQGWDPVFVSGPANYDDAFLGGDAGAEGSFAVARTAPYSLSDRMAPYRDAVTRHVPSGRLADTGAAAWVNGKLLERVFELIGERAPSRELVIETLLGLRGETLGGLVPPLTFPDGAHGDVNLCTVPIQVSGGQFTAPLGTHVFACTEDGGIREVHV